MPAETAKRRQFPLAAARLAAAARALRPHQWMKNLLVFLPLIGAHRLLEAGLLLQCLLALCAFSLCASGIYVFNDLLDRKEDALHPVKRRRPLASGDLPPLWGIVLAPILLAGGFGVGAALPEGFLFSLAGYTALGALYCTRLRREPLLDVFSLTLLYSLRVVGGYEVTGVPYSGWLLGLTFFLFLSLSLMKRYTELLGSSRGGAANGRGYEAADLPAVRLFGIVSGYLAGLVLALYVESSMSTRMYHRPYLLWVLAPLLLLWVSRMWLIAGRGRMHSDPVWFALRDGPTWTAGLVSLAVLAAAALG